jgi:hypothetical protein
MFISYWASVADDAEEGRKAKCKRIQGPRSGSSEDAIFVNDVQHLQHSNEMKFNYCRVDVEGWHCLYSCNYPVVF